MLYKLSRNWVAEKSNSGVTASRSGPRFRRKNSRYVSISFRPISWITSSKARLRPSMNRIQKFGRIGLAQEGRIFRHTLPPNTTRTRDAFSFGTQRRNCSAPRSMSKHFGENTTQRILRRKNPVAENSSEPRRVPRVV